MPLKYIKYIKYIKYGIILAVLLGTAFLGYNYAVVLGENEQLSQENTELYSRIETLQSRIEKERQEVSRLQSKNDILDSKFNDTVRKLQSSKDVGQDLLNKEPSIMGKKIQKSFNDIQSRIECATGEESRCERP